MYCHQRMFLVAHCLYYVIVIITNDAAEVYLVWLGFRFELYYDEMDRCAAL